MINLFGNIIRNFESIERDIAIRQLATKPKTLDSWFIEIVKLLELYELPLPHDLIVSPPNKLQWKHQVKSAIHFYWTRKLKLEAKEKSSLKFLNLESITPGTVHNIWESCGSEPFATTSASIKCKIACGTYTLQKDKAKFSKNDRISSTCKLCFKDSEDIIHFKLSCEALQPLRIDFLTLLRDELLNHTDFGTTSEIFSNDDLLAGTKFSFLNSKTVFKIETISRGFCYKLHQKRSAMLVQQVT